MIALAAKRPLADGFSRRGACPALSTPMQTGDGLLLRLNPVSGGLSPKALIGLCDAAETYGNGVVEVTARGGLQIRGLTETSTARFAQAVDQLGISVRTGVPVQTGVLAGLDPDEIADPTALAEMIRVGIVKARLEARLGPKVSVVIDGGGRTALDEVAADIRLTATTQGGSRSYWRIAIAGDARMAKALGLAEDDRAACVVTLTVLSEIAATGREARARDLSDEQLLSSISRLEVRRSTLPPSGAKERDVSGSLMGIVELRGARLALGIALPFGHTTANLLKTFAEKAQTLGVGDIRPAPRRTLVAICGTAVQAEVLRKQAESLGFVTSPDDPRQAISACPGAPDCASGHIPARQIAAEISNEYSDLLDGSVNLHVSGCTKGCAHPGKAELTIVGGAAVVGLVAGGTARDEPLAYVANGRAKLGLAGVAALVGAERREGEMTAQAIKRIGLSTLAKAFRQGEK